MWARIAVMRSSLNSPSRKSQSCRIEAAQSTFASLCMLGGAGAGAHEPEIAGVGEERVLKEATTAEEARAHRPDGHLEDLRRRLVRLILEIHEHHRRAEGL